MSIDKIVKVFVNNKPRALEYVIYEGQIIIKCKSISISNVSITGYFNLFVISFSGLSLNYDDSFHSVKFKKYQ